MFPTPIPPPEGMTLIRAALGAAAIMAPLALIVAASLLIRKKG